MTDRTLRDAESLDRLVFDDAGLVPVVTQDATTGRILMLAYANREALEASLDSGELHFWSRSRRTLWHKGETSGNTLTLRSLHADCDGDAVLATVDPNGPACHTGEQSCFGAGSEPPDRDPRPDTTPTDEAGDDALARLDATLAARTRERPEGSYTVRLLEDPNLRMKKLGEETAELVAALAGGRRDDAVAEAADLVYHVLVALRAEGLTARDLLAELASRAS